MTYTLNKSRVLSKTHESYITSRGLQFRAINELQNTHIEHNMSRKGLESKYCFPFTVTYHMLKHYHRHGSNAAVATAAAEVCRCGWLRFLAVLRDLYDWYCG
ncbi:hypothetical protein YC2023_081170 [Brassica napus]